MGTKSAVFPLPLPSIKDPAWHFYGKPAVKRAEGKDRELFCGQVVEVAGRASPTSEQGTPEEPCMLTLLTKSKDGWHALIWWERRVAF